MTKDVKTEISANGLRYVSKASADSFHFAGSWGRSMSCFLCGKNVPRSAMRSFKLAGGTRFRCLNGCD
jgi:hypothetical protein